MILTPNRCISKINRQASTKNTSVKSYRSEQKAGTKRKIENRKYQQTNRQSIINTAILAVVSGPCQSTMYLIWVNPN